MEAVTDSLTTQHAIGTPAPGGSRLGAHFALLFMTVIWAVNFSVTKLALSELTPLAFNALRFMLASAVVYVALRRRGRVPLPAREDIAAIVGLGLLGNGIYQMLFILGIDRTGAGTASLLLAGSPLITALLSALLGHERVRPRVWFGVCGTLLGISLVVGFGSATASSPSTLGGNLLLIGATIAWSTYTVGSRPFIAKYGSVPVTAWTLWMGTPFIVLIGVRDLTKIAAANITPGMWLAVLYGGVLSIGIAYLIWYYGVSVLGNTRTSVYSNLTPALAMLVAWLWLGEVPSAGQLAGAAIIVGGVTLAQSRGRAAAPTTS